MLRRPDYLLGSAAAGLAAMGLVHASLPLPRMLDTRRPTSLRDSGTINMGTKMIKPDFRPVNFNLLYSWIPNPDKG